MSELPEELQPRFGGPAAPASAPAGEAPTSIAQARFQAAFQSSTLTSEERRRRRHAHRRSFWPPAFIYSDWALSAPFTYAVNHPGSEERYTVPRGYCFDGASVPWPLTAFVPNAHARYIGAAALHDHLYQHHHEDVPRARADAIFREAMLVLGLNWMWAALMWRAVRAGGWMVWYKRKPGTLARRFLDLPWILRGPLGLLWTVVLGLAGALVVDLWNLGAYRDQARRIAELDRET